MSNTDNTPSLGFCILMDAIGMASYLIPGVGEFADLIWAPISAIIFYNTFNSTIGAVTNAAEEIIPFTDIVPTFTIAYFIKS